MRKPLPGLMNPCPGWLIVTRGVYSCVGIMCLQIHKYKYTNPNTNTPIQLQIHQSNTNIYPCLGLFTIFSGPVLTNRKTHLPIIFPLLQNILVIFFAKSGNWDETKNANIWVGWDERNIWTVRAKKSWTSFCKRVHVLPIFAECETSKAFKPPQSKKSRHG